MSSKSRFKASNSNANHSRSKVSSRLSNSSSKINISMSGINRGNNTSTNRSSVNIQVIFNDKIATPLSLLPTKEQTSKTTKKTKHDFSNVPTIDESKPDDSIDRSNQVMNKQFLNHIKSTIPLPGMQLHATQLPQVDEEVIIKLHETETNILFSMKSLVISNDTRDIKDIEERNSKYEQLIQSHKNSDDFASKLTQTMNNPSKDQSEMVAPNASQDFECQANIFDITEKLRELEEQYSDANAFIETESHDSPMDHNNFVDETVKLALITPGCLLNPDDLRHPRQPTDSKKKAAAKKSKLGTSASRADSNSNAYSQSFAFDTGTDVSSDGRSSGAVTEELSKVDTDTQSEVNSVEADSVQEIKSSEELLQDKKRVDILSQPVLLKRLQMLERAIQQNAYHQQHIEYRDLPEVKSLVLLQKPQTTITSTPKSPHPKVDAAVLETNIPFQKPLETSDSNVEHLDSKIDLLFHYHNTALVNGRCVTAMSWNAVNADILAVGYGNLAISDETSSDTAGGLILFWSLRNPDYPEKILKTPNAVTSLDFSKQTPTLLAVGFANGEVSIYDVRREAANWDKPIESSSKFALKGLTHGLADNSSQSNVTGHSDPVWQVKWIMKGIDHNEVLVSISTDGLVLEWNLKKGLVLNVLMQLKRSSRDADTSASSSSIKRNGGWISRYAAGLCFDFIPNDCNSYVVGTEDGGIHRCSVSYNEQYVDSYSTHEGPVYKLKFSEKWHDVFLSASSDWMMNLYHVHCKTPLLSMRPISEDFAVNDICWCPGNSIVFGAVTSGGKLEVWDLSISAIDPVILVDTMQDLKQLESLRSRDSMQQSTDANEDDESPVATSYSRHRVIESNQEEVNKIPLTGELIKNLSNSIASHQLTCLQFGEKSPILAVGDNHGNVLIYRVTDPITISQESPFQQTQNLKDSVLKQVSPKIATILRNLEASRRNDDLSSSSLDSQRQ